MLCQAGKVKFEIDHIGHLKRRVGRRGAIFALPRAKTVWEGQTATLYACSMMF